MKQKSLLFGEIAVKGELNELFKVKTKAKTKSLDKDKETPVNVTAAPKETPRIEEDGEEEVAVTFCEQEDQVGEVNKAAEAVESSKPTTSSAATAFTRREKIAEIIEKNSRTLFVGNLPTAVIEKAPTALLKSHFSAFGPLESIRFRSLAFSEKMPRKQAFISRKLHEGRDSLNAYIVFKKAEDAQGALLALDGKVFMERHLRVDHSEQKQEKKRDTKKCVFLGNMPFNVSDESVWSFFKDVGDIEYVRVIRDHKTNVGKGFGYVHFTDRASVGLALKCDGGMLEGRKVRITRAKEELAQVARRPVAADRPKGASIATGRVNQGDKKGKNVAVPTIELGARAKRGDRPFKLLRHSKSSSKGANHGVSKKRALKKR